MPPRNAIAHHRRHAFLGRIALASLQVCRDVVYQLLKVWWSAEDWPSLVAVGVALGYFAFALLATPRWLAANRKGPLEALWVRCAGTRRA